MSQHDWQSLVGMPLDGEDPAFEAPWQAQAFAMTVALHEKGVFDWPQWAEALGAQIASDPSTPYWSHWLATLETVMTENELASPNATDRRQRDWLDAAARTPHGEAIEL